MLFDEYLETVEIYRRVAPDESGWGDPVWTLIGTIQGRFEPIDGNENFVQNQLFADVAEIFLTDYVNKQYLRTEDALVDSLGVQRRIAGELEEWKWDLLSSHIAAKCRRAQWEV